MRSPVGRDEKEILLLCMLTDTWAWGYCVPWCNGTDKVFMRLTLP